MEEWRLINNYEDYQISNLGRVKSLSRSMFNGKTYFQSKEKILKGCLSAGYLKVNLSKQGVRKNFKIHNLVAESFLNHKFNGYDLIIDHVDNNKLNNILSNLQLITMRENTSKDLKNCSSEYVGVYWDKRSKKWRAQIHINGRRKHLGMFTNELEASNSYQSILKTLQHEHTIRNK